MQYPLEEKIGDPDLLVGRDRITNIPKRLSKSRVILARRKSGKTSFVQRIFNQLWSENGDVIPFYLDYNGFRGGHNSLKLLNDKTSVLSVPGHCGPDGPHICFFGNCRFRGMSARIPVRTQSRGQAPENGAPLNPL